MRYQSNLALALLFTLWCSLALGAVIQVDPVVTINGSDGQCSLIEAIINSEDDAVTHGNCTAGDGADLLVLPNNFDFVLTQPYNGTDNGLPVINGVLEISGRTSTILRDSNAPSFRLMEVNSPLLEITWLEMAGGLSSDLMIGGGAMWVRSGASVFLDKVTFADNTAEGFFTLGGALRMDDSEVTIEDSMFIANKAQSDSSERGGGAIFQRDGELTVRRSSFIGNLADELCNPSSPDNIASTGGAVRIEAVSAMTLSSFFDTTFTQNKGSVGGAIHAVAIFDTGTSAFDIIVEVDRSTLVLNDATGCPSAGLGDGIYVQEAEGGDAVVQYGSSIMHSNGILVLGQLVGFDCQSNFPSQDFFSTDGNVLDPDGGCTTFGLDALVDDVTDVLDLTLNTDHYLPLREGAAVDFDLAGVNCMQDAPDQVGNLRANGPGQGGSLCDSGAIELYYPPEQRTLTVAVQGAGSGSVESTPAGIDCPDDCNADFPQTEMVSLIAAPDTGSNFAGWSGACSGTGTCVVDMSEDRMVTATFEPAAATLDVLIEGNGAATITSDVGDITCPSVCSDDFAPGTTVQLSVQPEPGSQLQNFAGDCTGETCQVVMSDDRLVRAIILGSGDIFIDGFE